MRYSCRGEEKRTGGQCSALAGPGSEGSFRRVPPLDIFTEAVCMDAEEVVVPATWVGTALERLAGEGEVPAQKSLPEEHGRLFRCHRALRRPSGVGGVRRTRGPPEFFQSCRFVLDVF